MESRLVVHSWDFDGLLASEYYDKKLKELIIRAAQEGRSLNMKDYDELAEYIVEKYPSFFNTKGFDDPTTQHVLFIGSDRQDFLLDLTNGFKPEPGTNFYYPKLSCYPFFQALPGAIAKKYGANITLDTLLLEDIYHSLKPGTTFEESVKKFFALDPIIAQRLAEHLQAEKLDMPAVDELIKKIKKILMEEPQTKENETNDKINKTKTKEPINHRYTDLAKLFIMYAQIHQANAVHARGRSFSYCFADDRFDILTSAENSLPKIAARLPAGTHVILEQFTAAQIEAEDKEKTEGKAKTESNEKPREFKQSQSIKGTGEHMSDAEASRMDVVCARSMLEIHFLDPIDERLNLSVNNRIQRDEAFKYIHLCIEGLDPLHKEKGLNAIREAMAECSNSKAEINIEILEKIISIAKQKFESKSTRAKGEARFFKNNPELATFYFALKSLDATAPISDALVATHHMILEKKTGEKNTKKTLRK